MPKKLKYALKNFHTYNSLKIVALFKSLMTHCHKLLALNLHKYTRVSCAEEKGNDSFPKLANYIRRCNAIKYLGFKPS